VLNVSNSLNKNESGIINNKKTFVILILEIIFSKLIDRLDNMKKHATGNGSSQCVLCADGFGMLGASSVSCVDCHKVNKILRILYDRLLFSLCAINVLLKLFIINKSYHCAKFVVKIVK
jgi:hypothetical protein